MDERLLEFFYKWHRFEKANNVDIIDFDLIQQGNCYPGAFVSRKQVEEELQGIINDYNTLPQKNAVIQAKLDASLHYLHALMGKQIPFHEYVSKTMGILPRPIPEEALQQQLSKVNQAYKKLGYIRDKEGIDKFAKENSISSIEDIEKSFISFRDICLPQFMDWLGFRVNLKYKVSFVDRNEYWMNWI